VIRTATLENRFEADLVSDALDQEGIDFVIKTFEDSAYDGLWVQTKGWGLLLVEEGDVDRARSIVADVRTLADSEPDWPAEALEDGGLPVDQGEGGEGGSGEEQEE
jgi:hypothetical protein